MKSDGKRVSLLDTIRRQQQAAAPAREIANPDEYLREIALERAAPGDMISLAAQKEDQERRYALGWYVMNNAFPRVVWGTGEVVEGEADWEAYIQTAPAKEIAKLVEAFGITTDVDADT